MVKLCEAGCTVIFKHNSCVIFYEGKIAVYGTKCKSTGLLIVPLNMQRQLLNNKEASQLNKSQINNIHHTSNQSDLIQYIQQCLFSPTTATLIKAINNNQLLSFPGLTSEAVAKHLQPSTATMKGHMHRNRKNIQSTRKPVSHNTEDTTPTAEANATCEVYCFAALADSIKGTIYSDLTGKFPIRLYKGNQYIFLAYVYDANAILVRPMRNREATSMVTAFQDIYEYLTQRNFKPQLHVMDNECSKAVQQYITRDN